MVQGLPGRSDPVPEWGGNDHGRGCHAWIIVVGKEEDNRIAGRKRAAEGNIASDSRQTACMTQGGDYQEEEAHYSIINGGITNRAHGHKGNAQQHKC